MEDSSYAGGVGSCVCQCLHTKLHATRSLNSKERSTEHVGRLVNRANPCRLAKCAYAYRYIGARHSTTRAACRKQASVTDSTPGTQYVKKRSCVLFWRNPERRFAGRRSSSSLECKFVATSVHWSAGLHYEGCGENSIYVTLSDSC